MQPTSQVVDFKLASDAFIDGATIPALYTCKGKNISPPLTITNIPNGAKSLALIMHDPDAPNGDFTHWLVWNISPGVTKIAENSVPPDSVQGTTSFGGQKYGGPCPPSGTHHYIFDLYALNTTLDLSARANRQDLQSALAGRIIAETKLTGIVSAD